MSSHFILALDQGTTSSRSMIFDKNGNILAKAQKEFRQIFPKAGWVEHDAEEIWSSQYGAMAEAIAKAGITMTQIAGIGITNQRETTVVWERNSGKPIYNAIVWQDRRTADYCEKLKADGLSKPIQEKTGLIIDAYFLCYQTQMDFRQCARSKTKSPGWRTCFWHYRQLADLESYRYQTAYYRCNQCIPHHVVQHS